MKYYITELGMHPMNDLGLDLSDLRAMRIVDNEWRKINNERVTEMRKKAG